MFTDNHFTRALDSTLEMAKSGKYPFSPWVVLHSLPGFGKTASTLAWLEFNKLKNIRIDAPTLRISEIEVECLPANGPHEEGVFLIGKHELENLFTPFKKKVKVVFDSSLIDEIDKQTVICIDNYDKASQEQRDELMKLIHYHHVIDPREENNDKIKVINPLMLIVMIDDAKLITKNPLTFEEMKLLGLEEFM